MNFPRAPAALVLLGGLALARAAGGEDVLYPTEGAPRKGRLVSLSPQGELVFASEGRERFYLLERVAVLELGPERAPPGSGGNGPPRRPPHAAPHRALLQDGTRLVGTLARIEQGEARLVWGPLEGRELTVPLRAARLLLLAPPARPDMDRLPRPYLDTGPAAPPLPFERLRLADGSLEADGKAVAGARAVCFPPLPRRPRAPGGWYARALLDTEQIVVGRARAIDARRVRLATRFLGELDLPREQVWRIAFGPDPGTASLGLTLVAESHGGRVTLLDPAGKPLWRIGGLAKPHDVEPLPDGTFLIAEYQAGRVVQMTREGKVVWQVTGLNNPIDVDRLPNGNRLVTEFSGGRLLEYDLAGKLVWEWTGLKYPNEAEPVAGGEQVLVTESGLHRVFLADRKTRRILWEYGQLGWPMDADLLPGGNVLIADNNGERVIEVDRAGQVVWEFRCEKPYEADRLENGNTLIVETGKNRLIEVSPDRRIVWQAEGLHYPVAATRY